MRRFGQVERAGELGERGGGRSLLRFLVREVGLEVLLGVLLHEPHIVGAFAAERTQHADPLTLELGQPQLDHRPVVRQGLDENLLRNRDRPGAAAAPARLLGHRGFLITCAPERERARGDRGIDRRFEPEIAAARGVEL